MSLGHSATASECQDIMSLFIKEKKVVKNETNLKAETSKLNKKAPSPPEGQSTKSEISFTKLDKNISMRIENGEITRVDYQLFIKVNDDFKKKTNESLLGDGMNKCFEEFSPEAAESLVKLLNKANGATSINDAFNKLVKGSEQIFGDTPPQAKAKICALSGGGKCKIFSNAIGKNCK